MYEDAKNSKADTKNDFWQSAILIGGGVLATLHVLHYMRRLIKSVNREREECQKHGDNR